MYIHVFQYMAFAEQDSIAQHLNETQHQISSSNYSAKPCQPSLKYINALIIMVGPMSMHDRAEYPWWPDEKDFVCHLMATGKPMLAICLGAQFIVSAFGAEVHVNRYAPERVKGRPRAPPRYRPQHLSVMW